MFNRTKEFEEEIAPKMAEIEDLCLKYKIPFFAVFGTKQREDTGIEKLIIGNTIEETEDKSKRQSVVDDSEKAYCLMPALFSELETSDKTFDRLVAVMNGAQTIPASEFWGFSAVEGVDVDVFEQNMPTSL